MKILYFAWLRQKVGVGEETVTPPSDVATVDDLISWLAGRSEGHAAAFGDLAVVRVAVNQDYVGFDRPVAADDEVAFFPPVTGG
jgi:molybdopterin converting factor subunit 1